ncbi:radical SAM protein [Candidatus Woesearchaeota archaeon]|nr:radical SAM protein [Candidatus Woesearchaeota archaeon]
MNRPERNSLKKDFSVFISYPSIKSEKGTAQIGQNRQFQWFKQHSVIYPIVPAYAATLLGREGYDVFWDDAIAKEEDYETWLSRIEESKPDLIAIETKTPVVKRHWEIINQIKEKSPHTKTVLMGDHVTKLPEESMEKSKTDFVITGGDYDFILLNICNHLTKGDNLESGIWYRDEEHIINTGKFNLNHDLNKLPLIDRELTMWKLYSENGNYKYLPGTYTMVGRDCWWGRCKFCSWPSLYPKYRTRSPESLFEEIKQLVEKYKVKEVMDDTGTFPVGDWLKEFCGLMIDSGLNKKVRISCNMRFGILKYEDYLLMRKAGFRFLLFGLESANQETLDMIDKGIKVEDIRHGCMIAKKAGLNPHLTVMIGYPWETYKMAQNTINLAKDIFEEGYADTLQATIVMPYPNTSLYKECKKNNLLEIKHRDWEKFDMRSKILKSPLKEEQIKELTSSLYKLFFTPKYAWNQFISIRNPDDVKYLFRGFSKIVGKHLRDFAR